MITERDVQYHPAPDGNPEWAESNFFGFYIPEKNLCGCIYVLTRQQLGVTFGEVMIFDKLSRNRQDLRYLDTRHHMPAPKDLSNFTLLNGLSIKCVNAPRDYDISYKGLGDMELDLKFRAIMDPFDLHENKDPEKASAAEDPAMQFPAYKGHFDMSGRITGTMTLGGETYVIDCIDTMDHSWGPRTEGPRTNMAWLHAHFGEDAFHGIFMIDYDAPVAAQYHFVRGYVIEDGKTFGVTKGRLTAVRMDDFTVGADIELTDERGRTHRYLGGAVSGTMATWFSALDIFLTLHRWVDDQGRRGYGCIQEGININSFCLSGRG
jgi:hypothetical protein